MELGIQLPHTGEHSDGEAVARIADQAEALGLDSVWVLERLFWSATPKSPYAGSKDGIMPAPFKRVLDPLTTLSFAAGRTRRLKLGTSVLVLPYHNPVLLAKRLASLDVLSGGRLIVGVGVGWNQDEFDGVGVSMRERGRRTDEIIEVMKALWTQEHPQYTGSFWSIGNVTFEPKPIQKPHPPIFVAGFTEASMKRAVAHGDGWNPTSRTKFDKLESAIKKLHGFAEAAGRDPQSLGVSVRSTLQINAQPSKDRFPLEGTWDEVTDDVVSYRQAGVTHLFIDMNFTPALAPPEVMAETMQTLADRCLPAAHG